ncbi:hypothetical protein LOK49_LG15G00861 [Camellia lanceoleosa]|uniref:Uncharacterized protein n=1 Tax=Camellia lanceoleosa TaxID=1840588 RepID=A0ACC0F214_9ERIC|nr:hypothetical protein LOK49_LG15G00861 [Camellia lanceoleosa]
MNQKNKEKHIEDDSKKPGDHGGPISPPGRSYKAATVLHEKKNENLSKKQGDHGRPISPTGSYKGTKAAISRKNEKTTVPVHHQKKKEKGGVLNSTVSTKSDILIDGKVGEFADAHELKASDVIRVFKVSKPEPVKHYFIDYVSAEEVAGATVTQSCRPGKNRGGDSDDRGGEAARNMGMEGRVSVLEIKKQYQ